MTREKQEEVAAERLDRPAVLELVRQFVRDQMSKGASAPDLTFALAYVATDLGLAIAPDPLRVYPVVLEGISQASFAHSDATSAEAEECKSEQTAIPNSSTVH